MILLGIEETLRSHKASWHKSCFNKCNNLKLQRAEKRRYEESIANEKIASPEPAELPSPPKLRVRLQNQAKVEDDNVEICFFCDKADGLMHKASTMDIDTNVRSAANTLQDWRLLGKLAKGDMHAMDAYYHKSCLTSLYNRQRRIQQKQAHSSTELDQDAEIPAEAIALAELTVYMEESAASGTSVFKMSDLAKVYSSRLEQLGVSVAGRVNTTRLKDRLLAQIPELQAFSDGKEVKLAFSQDIGMAMEFANTNNFDTAAMYLAKAATVVRKEMFIKRQSFTGTFTPGCQERSVPDSLLALVNMILEGPSIRAQNEQESVGYNASLTLSQLLVFNAVKHARSGVGIATRHDRIRETPLSIYLALVIHGETRKKTLVDKFYKLGMCISYDRLMQISADLGNNVCNQFEKEGVVCPQKLRKDLFISGSVDNIDHNPSSRTSKDSFHGTAISLTQHPTLNVTGMERNIVLLDPNVPKSKTVSSLPEYYANVIPVAINEAKKDIICPKGSGSCKPKEDPESKSTKEEYQWLEKVEILLDKEKLEEKNYLSWSAHFASLQKDSIRPNAITSLLPLFEESAHTVAMIQHAMKIVKASTSHLNPLQIPVITMDQPLYAIAKQIQWKNTAELGEGKYMVMMGGLHIEMATLKMIGNWLSNSGWDR